MVASLREREPLIAMEMLATSVELTKKVVAASRQGANIFLPLTIQSPRKQKKADPNAKSNYETALEAAKTIKTEMKIVPVKTLQDAIDYLKNNP